MKKLQRNILLLVLLALGSSLMTYKVYAQTSTVQPVQGLEVFDSKGKRVGNVLGFHPSRLPVVSCSVGGRLVILAADSDRFTANPNIVGSLETFNLFFESVNCSGTPFVGFDTSTVISLVPITVLYVTGGAGKLYVPDGLAQTITVKSFTSGTDCIEADGPIPDATPVRLILDLATQFQPPFRLGQSAGTP